MLSLPGRLVPSPVAFFQQLLGSLVEELTVAEKHLNLHKYNSVVAFVVLAENDPACSLLHWSDMRFFNRFVTRLVIRVFGLLCIEQERHFVAHLLRNIQLHYLLHGFE